MQVLNSTNLIFKSLTYKMFEMAIHDKDKLSNILEAKINKSWPVSPEGIPFFIEQIKLNPGNSKWLDYVAIHKLDRQVIGDVGFLGPPNDEGEIEIGYSVIPEYRKRGFGTEMVACLTDWAFFTGKIKKIFAHTLQTNAASLKVLEKNKFLFLNESDSEEGVLNCFVREFPHNPRV